MWKLLHANPPFTGSDMRITNSRPAQDRNEEIRICCYPFCSWLRQCLCAFKCMQWPGLEVVASLTYRRTFGREEVADNWELLRNRGLLSLSTAKVVFPYAFFPSSLSQSNTERFTPLLGLLRCFCHINVPFCKEISILCIHGNYNVHPLK